MEVETESEVSVNEVTEEQITAAVQENDVVVDVNETVDPAAAAVENVASVKLPESTSVTNNNKAAPEKKRLVQFPLLRVKQIMKYDLECAVVSQDSVFLVTKATELFLEFLAKESVKYTNQSKRKTLVKRDVDNAVAAISHLCFLDGILE